MTENSLDVDTPAVYASRSRPTKEGRRLSVNVALDVADAIDHLAKKRGLTITDVIRRAVSTYKFIDDETSGGGKILVERNGKIREVTFL
jgi:ribbon-helix-helix CopG family protein